MRHDKERISGEYSKALRKGSRTVVAKTGNAAFADYSEEDLKGLGEDVLEHSFGCGNPLAFSDVREGDVVLDLGCGAGLDLLLAAERVGSSGLVIGVDMNADMLVLAERRIKAAGCRNVILKQGVIEALPVESDSVDWVISNCVINLSPEKPKAFAEIARVLKPGGRMVVSDIVAENLPWWVRHSGVMTAACGGGVISEKEYLAGLKAAGLRDCQVIARNYYDADQLAFIVSEAAPDLLRRLTCCGKSMLHSLLTKLARPVARNLWSAKISAAAP